MKRLKENLENKNNHYLYPFFWQHGESLDVIKEYMDQMYTQGIYHICIESRPHPEFLAEGWWETMDCIIHEAKKRNMKIWILDDARFPTGYANGKVPKHLKKRYLNYRRFDVVGTNEQVEINLDYFVDMRELMRDKRHQEDCFFKAILVENDVTDKKSFKEETLQDVSHCYDNHTLHLSLENKHYSVFVLYETICGEETTQDYLDPMRKEATQVLIDEVYEKHFQHYQDEFGKTIVGFFSDEPRFGNIKGPQASIGRKEMPLPWNHEVYDILKKTKDFTDEQLVFLFLGQSEKASMIRFQYMDIITRLYSENFSQYIGKWCQSRGVDYIGHVIEDNNAHARLGYGVGHYFRGIAGQTIAGIDIIGGQVVPGMDYYHDAFSTGGSDGEFYHYALVKMGASSAKLDPQKNGRLMCEAFGAYGWVEGLKMMKWITDHMLSHGVNVIVPHAFNPAPFPDWDCPPHFYAHGQNPQYPYFHKWSHYADRLCHLLSGGYHEAKIGVLYHAFGEWSGEYMLMQKVLKELQQHQIACDIISEDYLLDAQINNQSYIINNYEYEVLIIPYAQRLPQHLLKKIEELSQHIQVVFMNDYPVNMLYKGLCQVLELSSLSQQFKQYQDVKCESNQPYLVTYHYIHDDGEVMMLNNEDICHCIDTNITLENKNWMIYDAYSNQTYQLEANQLFDKKKFHLHLEPYQSIILVTGKSNQKLYCKGQLLQTIKVADVALKSYQEQIFSSSKKMFIEDDLTKLYPHFSGQIQYHFELNIEQKNVLLELEEAYEIFQIIVNGKDGGTYIAPPYIFDLSQTVVEGKNQIEIITTNNLSRNQRDAFSVYIPIEPLGIRKNIKIYSKEEKENEFSK